MSWSRYDLWITREPEECEEADDPWAGDDDAYDAECELIDEARYGRAQGEG